MNLTDNALAFLHVTATMGGSYDGKQFDIQLINSLRRRDLIRRTRDPDPAVTVTHYALTESGSIIVGETGVPQRAQTILAALATPRKISVPIPSFPGGFGSSTENTRPQGGKPLDLSALLGERPKPPTPMAVLHPEEDDVQLGDLTDILATVNFDKLEALAEVYGIDEIAVVNIAISDLYDVKLASAREADGE